MKITLRSKWIAHILFKKVWLYKTISLKWNKNSKFILKCSLKKNHKKIKELNEIDLSELFCRNNNNKSDFYNQDSS